MVGFMDDGIARENREEDRQLLDVQWQKQQNKSFTAWVNSHLCKMDQSIDDIATDFKDGRRLIKLIEIISGDKLHKPERGKMRVHHIQNINIALDAIASKGVRLAGVSAEEIADCNLKLILGMVWILILRFQIQDISVEEMSAKEGLLLWCQRKTAGYPNCQVTNFHTSFQDGNAFCALIHRHRPGLLNYDEITKLPPKDRLNTAFRVAEEHLQIPQMLDANDMLETTRPDERSVMTYVAAYYHAFAGMGKTETAARRLATVLGLDKEFAQLKVEYETRTSDLLDWVAAKQNELSANKAYQQSADVAASIAAFHKYKKSEKPPKSEEKAQLEAHYSTLQTKLRLNNRPPYHPVEGRLLSDINRAWKVLDNTEKAHEAFLRSEQERLERIVRLARKFQAKAAIHNKWMGNRGEKLRTQEYGRDLPSVTALIRQQKATEGDIEAHKDRVPMLRAIADQLQEMGHPGMAAISADINGIETEWTDLCQLVAERTKKLDEANQHYVKLDELQLSYARQAVAYNTWAEGVQEDLLGELGVTTLEGLKEAKSSHTKLQAGIHEHKSTYENLLAVADRLTQEGITDNPYTALSRDAVQSAWDEVATLVRRRDQDLAAEQANQEAREALRQKFAEKGNELGRMLEERLLDFRERPVTASLEEQLAAVQSKQAQNAQLQGLLAAVHEVANRLEEAKIYENPLANYTVEELEVLLDQLQRLTTKTINTIENQILMRDQSGITEEQMKEYKESFDFFDRDQTGELSPIEFRSCLLSIGYDVPEPKPGEEDNVFTHIMNNIDPERTDRVTFEAFLDFMSRDKQDTNSAEQFMESFKLIAAEKPYVTEEEIRRELSPEVAEFVLARLEPYPGVPGALDYRGLAAAIFAA